MHVKKLILASALALGCTASARAGIVITEVDPSGSAAAGYIADWFELTNTGASAVNISGWSMDDNSFTAGTAPLMGVTSIAPGQSVVFIDGGTLGTPATDATVIANFETAWFGATVPAAFTIGTYHGAGVGLSGSGDEVNIFDASNASVTGVSFGLSTANITLDNSVAQSGGTTANPRPTISTNSVAGTNGAFTTTETTPETGSPGVIANAATTPEPASLAFLGFGAISLLTRRRKMGR